MSLTVLVVEDDEILRSLTADAISLLNFVVLEGSIADEALSLLESPSSIALVVTDVCMPGRIDGLELAKVIWSRWPNLPVILTSGNTVIPVGLLPPHAAFLRKPWSLDTLYQAVKTFLP